MTRVEEETIKTSLQAVAKLQTIVKKLVVHSTPTDSEWQDAADTINSLIALANLVSKDLMKEVNSAN